MSKTNPGAWLIVAFLAGLAGGMAGSWLVSPAPVTANNQKALVAGELRLTDQSGRTRLLLSMVQEKPRLFMLDEAGEYRLEMGLGSDGEPHLWLRDKDGASKVQVSLTENGRPAFRLADHQGRERATFGLSEKGDPTIILRDEKGMDRLALWRDSKEAGLALADQEGRPIAAFSATDQGRARLSFFEINGKTYRVVD